MKIPIIYIAFLTIVCVSSSISQDTIRHYENSNSLYMLKDDDINEYAERFILDFEGEINGLRFKANGKAEDKGVVKIYGNEVSDVIPSIEFSLIDDINFKKAKEGAEWISIHFKNPIKYSNKQLFVSVEFENKNTKLYTEKYKVNPYCESSNCFNISYQLIKRDDGEWKLLESSFLVELIITKYDKYENIHFRPFNFGEIEDILQPVKSISIFDFNKDGLFDILTNQYLLINLGQNKFKKSDLVDSNSNCIANIVLNDSKGTKIMSLISNSKFHYIQNIKNQGNELTSIVDSFKIDHHINDLQSYSLKDIDNDDYLDVVIAINKDSISEVLVLTHNLESKYVKTFEFSTELISTISFNPLVDYKNQLLINFISDKMDIYEVDNTGISTFNFSEQTNYLNTDYYIADINNDGKTDLISINQNKPSINIQEFMSNNLPVAQFKSIESDDNELYSPIVEDFDNNGYKDIILTTRCDCRKGSIFYQDKTGSFNENTLLSGFNDITIGPSLLKCDINNDGKMDFISISNGKLIGFINNSSNNNNYIQLEDRNNEITEVFVHTNKSTYVSVAVPNGRSFLIQEPNVFHLGVPEDETIDSLITKSKLGENVYTNIKLNNKYNIEELKQIKSSDDLIEDFKISPNPFKTNVSLILNLPLTKKLKKVRIYNQSGQIVFYKEITSQKRIIWNGKNKHGEPVASGAYIATIESDGIILKNKLLKID
jgi:hypothetical protein